MFHLGIINYLYKYMDFTRTLSIKETASYFSKKPHCFWFPVSLAHQFSLFQFCVCGQFLHIGAIAVLAKNAFDGYLFFQTWRNKRKQSG